MSLHDALYQNETDRGNIMYHVFLALDIIKPEHNYNIVRIVFPLLSISQIWGKKDSVCLCM